MKLEEGKHYKISLSIKGKILTYTCKITSIDDPFISFTDKYGGEYNYNKSLIISYQEIKDE